MEFISLKILDKFQKLFEKMGIDYEMMRVILKTKLILDTRRAPVLEQQNKKNSEKGSVFKGYFFHLFFGVMLAFFIYFIKDEMIRMIYFTGAFFFMTTMYLISDFSFVLLGTKDKNILLTKPIDSRIISVSKALHVLIYMFRLNLFIAGPSLIAVAKLNGAVAIPIFLVEILMMDLLIFLITAFIYLVILRFFDGELLRNIINLIQILLTVVVTIGYQIAIRMIDFSDLQNLTYNFKFSNYFNPILWFGAPFELFTGGRETYLYIFTVLLVAVPLTCFWLYFKLSKNMESLLLKLEGEGGEKHSRHVMEKLIGMVLCRTESVKQAYEFANAVYRSDRSLKLKIYPALSTGIFIPVLMLFNMGIRRQGFESSGFEYLYLYFSLLIVPSVLELTLYSSAWKGSCMYTTSGFMKQDDLYRGIMLAVVMRFYVPLMILNSAVYIFVFKKEFIVDMSALFIAGLALLPILGKIYFKALPFSKPIDESNQNKSIDKYFLSLGIVFCGGIIHALLRLLPNGTWIYMAVSFAAMAATWKFTYKKHKTA